MGKGSGKRATRKRVADVSAAAREDAEQLKRATRRRLAKLEKDLAAVRKTEERRRSRLAAASAEADRIRREIAGLIRHASEPAVGGARKIGRAAGDLFEDAADAVADAAGGVMHAAGSVVHAASPAGETVLGVAQDAAGAVMDAAGSVVGAARRAGRARPTAATAPVRAKPVVTSRPARKPAKKPAKSSAPVRAGAATPATPRAPAPAKPATPRRGRTRATTPPPTGPDNG